MSEFEIIDSQMNYGKNIFGPDSDLETYLYSASSIGITKAILIPTGTHVLQLQNGTEERSCIWSIENGNPIYKKVIIEGKKEKQEINPPNPYQKMNLHSLQTVKHYNATQNKIKFYFAPKVHPMLDTSDALVEFLQEPSTVAIKIQGLATYTTPKDIPEWLIELSKKNNKPFIIHTDYLDTDVIWMNEEISHLIRNNSPYMWAKWAKENGVRAYLAHGLRLDPQAADVVNNSNNLIVGLGPDILLEKEQGRLAIKNQNYLETLFHLVDENKIAFSTDYRWNVFDRGKWDYLDWKTHERIITYANKQGKKKSFLFKIFYENAQKFFRID